MDPGAQVQEVAKPDAPVGSAQAARSPGFRHRVLHTHPWDPAPPKVWSVSIFYIFMRHLYASNKSWKSPSQGQLLLLGNKEPRLVEQLVRDWGGGRCLGKCGDLELITEPRWRQMQGGALLLHCPSSGTGAYHRPVTKQLSKYHLDSPGDMWPLRGELQGPGKLPPQANARGRERLRPLPPTRVGQGLLAREVESQWKVPANLYILPKRLPGLSVKNCLEKSPTSSQRPRPLANTFRG